MRWWTRGFLLSEQKIIRKEDALNNQVGRELRSYYFFDDFDDFEVIITTMQSQSQETFHKHREINEAIYVIKGEIEVIYGDVSTSLSEGDFIIHSKNEFHQLKNVNDKEAQILVIKCQRKPNDKQTLFS